MEYLRSAYFIYDEASESLLKDIKSTKLPTELKFIHVQKFLKDTHLIPNGSHIVVSIGETELSDILGIAHDKELSVGIVPLPSQKKSIKNLYSTEDIETNLEVALRDNLQSIDLVKINGEFVYSQGMVGIVPLVGESLKKTRSSFLRTFLYGVKKFFSLELQKFEITTDNGQKIVTAGSAVVVLNHSKSGLISKIFKVNHSMRDGQITIIIISPFSIFEYISLLSSIFTNSKEKKVLPKSIGYLQSKSFIINASKSSRIQFDNEQSMKLPLECEVVEDAIRLNASEEFWLQNENATASKETIKIANLPDSSESLKYMSRHIPFFRSASEDRFKELFQVLRGDSKLNISYIVLMVLSTLLATFGLFANSAAVIIGAMLVAPLMVPIVSVSMGFLRADSKMISDSLIKIGVGIIVAIFASSILTFMLPSFEITSEIISRINPTLLDLGVAILSGIAAAYSKSFKEISQNLAGVAIAVALVPPLSVAGIGLGYGEIEVFLGAFLLFFTNLIGIIIAAVITFQLLGFSNVLKSKKSVAFIFAILLAISYPLYLSSGNMIEKYQISQELKEHRFLVNNRYIIIENVNVIFRGDVKILNLDLVVRESLDRNDFEVLKEDIQRLLNRKLFIKTRVEFIL